MLYYSYVQYSEVRMPVSQFCTLPAPGTVLPVIKRLQEANNLRVASASVTTAAADYAMCVAITLMPATFDSRLHHAGDS